MISSTKRMIWEGELNFSLVSEPLRQLEIDEVLVKVIYSGICGSDTHLVKGLFPGPPPPRVLGHEFSGQVVDSGNKSNRNLIGDYVACEPYVYPCKNKCEFCIKNVGVACPNRVHFGAFSEYVIVPVASTHKIPKNTNLMVAAMTEPASCSLSGLKLSKFEKDMNMIITGGGIIGLLTGAFSKLLGAGHVIISDPIKERRDMAIKLGIDTAINPKEENLEQVAQKLLGNYGCDIAVEAVGNLELLKELYKIVKPKGTIQLAGVNNNGNNFPFDSFDFHYKELTLTGAFGMGNYFKESLSMLNCLDFGDFNAKSFPLDKIVEGFLNSIEAKNIKTFIKPNN